MMTFEQMIDRQHERVCFHQDPDTGLRAIIAVHSTKLGNALGGTRRWHYATEADALYDVLRLSEAMTYKAAVSDLPMGGAKSVVLLPRPGHPAVKAEARAMGRFVESFNGDYIAAEDVGVDPQYVDWMRMETVHAMGGQRGGNPSPFTARGVIRAMHAGLSHLGRSTDLGGLTVAIQGIGHVGRCLVGLLAGEGARVIVSDTDEDRLASAAQFGAVACAPDEILTVECDILAPCALGGVINANLARRLRCPIIVGAANNVLDDPDEDAVVLRNQGILYAPDVIANAGGLIHLAGVYLGMSAQEIDRKIDDIEKTMATVLQEAESLPSTYAAMVAYADRRIAGGNPADKERVHAG
ncbi:MAG: Glu/Leu/Phe/Val dehydrogenase dimerization domain-containing protein [Gemmatimonadales bacterium]